MGLIALHVPLHAEHRQKHQKQAQTSVPRNGHNHQIWIACRSVTQRHDSSRKSVIQFGRTSREGARGGGGAWKEEGRQKHTDTQHKALPGLTDLGSNRTGKPVGIYGTAGFPIGSPGLAQVNSTDSSGAQNTSSPTAMGHCSTLVSDPAQANSDSCGATPPHASLERQF